MAMTVMNNPSAMMSLGELNKNVSKLGKDLAKVASGQKIVGAGDGASEYAISERMRVRKRALDRDEANVQTGISLLNVAAGGIQQQIEIMKNIKAKVIDADNDSNTDLDRVTIQKEISQGFEHINDIAYETNYNGKLLLTGNKEIAKVTDWYILKQPELVPDSDLALIADVYDVLDGIEGPFDILPAFDRVEATAEPLLGSDTKVAMTGGTAGSRADPQTASPATFTMDFSGYTSANAEGIGFYVSEDGNEPSGYYHYVLTNSPSTKNYHYGTAKYENVTEIDISGCTTSDQVAAKVASAISGIGAVGNAASSGSVVTITTSEKGAAANNATAAGWSKTSDTQEIVDVYGEPSTTGRTGAIATGLVTLPITANGKAPTSGTTVTKTDWVSDGKDGKKQVTTTTTTKGTEGIYATAGLDIGTVAPGSGIRITQGSKTAYVRFEKGDGFKQDDTGVYVIGIDALKSNVTLNAWDNDSNDTSSGVRLSIANGQLTLQATTQGPSFTVKDGFYDSVLDASIASSYINTATGEIKANPGTENTYKTVTFEPVIAYTGNVTAASGGVDEGPYTEGDRASYTIDLTAYDSTDEDKLDYFVEELKGKILNASIHGSWEFIDTTVPTSFDAMRHASTYGMVDLKNLREAVAGGTTIADAFIGLMVAENPSYNYAGADCFEDASSGGSKALKINAYRSETGGNGEEVSITKGIMSAYTIDFKEYFANNPKSIPEDLYDKGFRVYCATCPEQWMNFHFVDGEDEVLQERPEAGESGADFKTTLIDISAVTDMKSLVEAIYNQGGYGLEHMDHDGGSHFLHFAADPEAGKLTVYDERMFNLEERNEYFKMYEGFYFYDNLQEKGAKLADGIYDDVQKATRKIYVNDLIIHHTDKASMNIHLQIPQTSMDHIFGYSTKYKSYTDFDVLTVEHREELLGNQAGKMSRDGTRMVTKNEPGLLDIAIQYLADAATLVGAQTSRLETTHDNIITQQESTAASESTIRDADMAKEMTEYTKSNILTQAAQSMLAQANQNASSVLSLLQ